jgi:hypothetical protein
MRRRQGARRLEKMVALRPNATTSMGALLLTLVQWCRGEGESV